MAWSMRALLSAGQAQGTDEGSAFCLTRHLAPLELLVSGIHQISVYLSQPLPVCAIPLYQTKPLHCKTYQFGHPYLLTTSCSIVPHLAISCYNTLPCRAMPSHLLKCFTVSYLTISDYMTISCFLPTSMYTCQDGSTPTCSHFSLTG